MKTVMAGSNIADREAAPTSTKIQISRDRSLPRALGACPGSSRKIHCGTQPFLFLSSPSNGPCPIHRGCPVQRIGTKPAGRKIVPIKVLARPIREADFKAAAARDSLVFDDADAIWHVTAARAEDTLLHSQLLRGECGYLLRIADSALADFNDLFCNNVSYRIASINEPKLPESSLVGLGQNRNFVRPHGAGLQYSINRHREPVSRVRY